ncbi:WD40/YVTN/BNR-like repeat-containing protein [Catenuloplanes atrovinosus]|uniref:Exo-alpha-sialidase n=1 Tax=Catenuloplanes atrovinosus TaxID=137266 RepID=A0AAE3YZ31_9ACTN|nr:exo-alpha-sialidase [Catenuloplanes atrovinosus]MDR7281176.1 hypothetical protein [Catenuloplanes atrovinosus]
MTRLLAIGTEKGLFLATHDGGGWDVSPPHFTVKSVYAVAIDTRGGAPRVLVGASSAHWGPSVAISSDLGKTWEEPDDPAITFPEDTGAALERVWQLTPGPAGRPEVVYAGTEPSALFRSEDGGRSFSLVRGLWDHPHRPTWEPGGGGQAIHTILPDPRDDGRMVVAMSTGGVYRTADGGDTWAPSNAGIKAVHVPDPFPEYGQCVHKVARDNVDPDRFYAQVHHGVYRSDDGAATWVSIADPLPGDFGFPMVAHPSRPGTIYNFPMIADMDRYPADHRCRVFRSTDAGASWEPLSEGLPTEPFYPSVLRDAMCVDQGDPAGVYFGAKSGEVFASLDEGDSWSRVAAHLPTVLCVRAAVI